MTSYGPCFLWTENDFRPLVTKRVIIYLRARSWLFGENKCPPIGLCTLLLSFPPPKTSFFGVIQLSSPTKSSFFLPIQRLPLDYIIFKNQISETTAGYWSLIILQIVQGIYTMIIYYAFLSLSFLGVSDKKVCSFICLCFCFF